MADYCSSPRHRRRHDKRGVLFHGLGAYNFCHTFTFFTTVFLLLFFIVYILKRQWRRAISFGLLPAYIAATIVFPQTLGGSLLLLGQSARFQANLPSYELEIAKLPNDGKRFAMFQWDGFAGSSTLIIYDESDELSKPLDEMNGVDRELIHECRITRYRDHYYWCTM